MLEKELEEEEEEPKPGELRYKGKKYSKQGQAQEQDFYMQAAVYGIQMLAKAHNLHGLEEKLEIDHQRLQEKINSIRHYLAGKTSWNEERKSKFFYDELTKYSISGEILTTQAQESILKIGLGKKK